MLSEDYELLVDYLEEMIGDGVQLAHGGELIDWSDTKILKLLERIHAQRAEQQSMLQEQLQPGDLLKNVVSGQKAAVMYEDKKSVHLSPVESLIVYPKDRLWQTFKRTVPGE